MSSTQKLYDQIIRISEEFLGPAGERFMRRQIEAHLTVRPEDIEPKHIPKLVDWVQLMFAMITDDTKIVNDFTNQLLGLAKNKSVKSVPRTK